MSECQELSKDFKPTLKKNVNPDDLLAQKREKALKRNTSNNDRRETSLDKTPK